MEIFTRKQWGAKYAPGFGSRKVGTLDKWLHHSVSKQLTAAASYDEDAAQVRAIENTGQTRFKGGISYTFLVMPSGRVFEGTGISRVGSHTGGRNTGSAGICLVGNYETNRPTEDQLEAVAQLLAHGVTAGWWTTPTLTGGHKDVSATACPGKNAYPRIGDINNRARAILAADDTKPAPAPAPKPTPPKAPTLRVGTRSTAVRHLQAGLNHTFPAYRYSVKVRTGRLLAVDGIFGAATEAWVKEFQRRVGVTVDGIVGPVTRAKLQEYGVTV